MTTSNKRIFESGLCDFVQEAYKDADILTTEEQIDLIKKYRKSRGKTKEVHKNKLVSTLWRYAVREADKFKHVIDESTARQAAYTGLITTLEKYRLNSGSALTTCMYWRVKLELIRTIYKVKYQIHLPEYLYTRIRKLIEDKCSYEDIARMTSTELANSIFDNNPSRSQVRKMEVFMQTGVPIDLGIEDYNVRDSVQIYGDDKYELSEISIDVNNAILRALKTQKIDPDTNKPIFSSYRFQFKDKKSAIIKIPDNLIDLRDYDIICMYYGINGRKGCGLKEISKEYNITKERVRQIRDRVHGVLKGLLDGYD